MYTTFTSGAARRNAIDEARAAERADLTAAVIDGINDEHDQLGRINPILDLFRDDTYSGDPDMHATATEFLFQLARHWSGWQSPRIGTFPLDYRDPSGPLSREDSHETGEDQLYWDIDDALTEAERALRFRGQNTDPIQDYIVHATAVLDRIYEATKDDA